MRNVTTFSYNSPFVHTVLSFRAGTLKLRKVEESCSWSLGVGFGYTKYFPHEGSFPREGVLYR